jgi:ATP-dependent protease HslVU (ClpYQ) peptidase subunit
MTCIVGLEHEGDVYIGGDSAGIEVYSLAISGRADEKVFLTDDGNFAMGFAGSFRIGQLLRYALVAPEQGQRQDDMAYMVTYFIDAVRAMQKERGALNKAGDHDVESQDAAFLVGYNGKLYSVEEDFQVGRPIADYAATGCGADIAMGAMYATRAAMMAPEERITLALAAAAEYSAGVRAPFHIVKLAASP